MNELIRITADEQGSLAVNSTDFAEGLGIQHRNLLETIRTHQEAIEQDFGVITFETEKPKNARGEGRPTVTAYLTEDQALFIGTLSRNSKRVVEFKSTLVRSFAEARKRLQPSTPVLTTEQMLLQLAQQQVQLLTNQQEQISQLRADIDEIRTTGHKLPAPAPFHRSAGKQLGVPGIPGPVSRPGLRMQISYRVGEYSARWQTTTQETYTYLYKRLFDVYGISTYRLNRQPGESMLDALERYGHLDKVYGLIVAELVIPDEQ